jgi:transcriptional regulator with XRE-family HTH domain
MMDDRPRQELAEFLKTRRARLAPAAVGLPGGHGRRTRGLRREEVAVLAGVGLTWYTWLEQGRDIRVSTPFLENIARALRLDATERAHLFALAQHRPPPHISRISQPQALGRVQAILDSIGSPAYAHNSRFDVIGWNGANTRMFGDFAAVPEAERNIVQLMFTRPHYRRTMPNWETDARGLVGRFRLNYGQASGSAEFRSLVQRMTATSAEFRRVWAEHAVSEFGEGVILYRTPERGTLAFRHQTLMPEAAPDLRICVYTPI